MEPDFKPGDLVQLKSGGPHMTIEDIGEFNWNGRQQALCKWFEGTKLTESTFELSSLKRVER